MLLKHYCDLCAASKVSVMASLTHAECDNCGSNMMDHFKELPNQPLHIKVAMVLKAHNVTYISRSSLK